MSLVVPTTSPIQSLVNLIEHDQSMTLIDVGANVGQFGVDMRNSGFKGPILSYEPVKSIYYNLGKTIINSQPWEIINSGLGSSNQRLKINVSNNSGLSSSILFIADSHIAAFPDSYTVNVEEIQICTLDDEIDRLQLDPARIVLKIDAQGFESEILQGGKRSIPLIPHLLLEISLIQLYEGEKTFFEMVVLLDKLGHQVIDIHRGTQIKSGQLLQVDIITKKKGL